MSIQDVCRQILPLDLALQTKAQTHLGRLTKPLGSLGKLEELATAYVTMTGELKPSIPVEWSSPSLRIMASLQKV